MQILRKESLEEIKKLSEYIHHISNEPSIGLFHVCDHIHRTIPKFVDIREELKKDTRTVKDFSDDIESTILTIKELQNVNTFLIILDQLTHSNNLIDAILNYQLKINQEREERERNLAQHSEELKINVRGLLEVNETMDSIYDDHKDT